MKSQVTLKTIAKALNLSTSTVSRALADQWDVNSQTKEIVMELATKLNYKPNIMAVKLKLKKAKTKPAIHPKYKEGAKIPPQPPPPFVALDANTLNKIMSIK